MLPEDFQLTLSASCSFHGTCCHATTDTSSGTVSQTNSFLLQIARLWDFITAAEEIANTFAEDIPDAGHSLPQSPIFRDSQRHPFVVILEIARGHL